MSFGLDPDAFWHKTPREISLIFEGTNERLVREFNDRVTLAWRIAGLTRTAAKNFPKKPDALFAKTSRTSARHPQTTEQMVAMAKMITVALGGEVVPREKMN